MTSPRVFSMITLLAPHLKQAAAKCASTSGAARAVEAAATAASSGTATSRKPRRFYKTWAEFWGANGANAHAATKNAPKTPGGAVRAQKKSSYVSTLFKRHSKSSNLSRQTIYKQMSQRTGSASKKAKKSAKAAKASKAAAEKVEVNTCMDNYEMASHALVMARLNNNLRDPHTGTGRDLKSDLSANIGVFLKGYATGRRHTGPLISFADHVKQAQARMLVPDGRLDIATQKLGISRKASSTGFVTNPKLFHVPTKKLEVSSASAGVSTDAPNYAPATSSTAPTKKTLVAPPMAPPVVTPPVAPRVSSKRAARPLTTVSTAKPPTSVPIQVKTPPPASHRELGIERNMVRLRRVQKQHPNTDSMFSYQPSRLPTMKALMKGYKDQDHEEVLIANKQTRIPRADDGKNIYQKRQLPLINMNDKCPMDDFIVQKTQPRIRYCDTAQSFRS